jgi:hypothetical protein
VAGVCSAPAACAAPNTLCGGTACVNLRGDPLNCGRCGTACGRAQVCLLGQCQDYGAAMGCNTCPCTACRGATCCVSPGGLPGVACVDGACP